MTDISFPSALDACRADMDAAFAILRDSISRGGKVLACGDGAAAANATHVVGELMTGFTLPRPLDDARRRQLIDAFPEDGHTIASGLQGAIPAVALVKHPATVIAGGKNSNAEMTFAQQILGLGNRGDVLLALSPPEYSPNLVLATKVARAFGLRVLVLTSEVGGSLALYADAIIRVPADHASFQELSLAVCYRLCARLKAEWLTDMPATALPRAGLPQTIGLIVFDFDGVFTDNIVYTAQDGTELVACDRADGLGIDRLRSLGIPMIILSTETNPVVTARAGKLNLPVEQGCGDKAKWLKKHMDEAGLDPASIVYVGNDVNDLEAMHLAGFTVTPADAHPEVRKFASLVLSRNGGRGAVRELSDIISRETRV